MTHNTLPHLSNTPSNASPPCLALLSPLYAHSALDKHMKMEAEDIKPQSIRRQTSVKRQASASFVKPNAFNKKISFKKMGSKLSPKMNERSLSMRDTHERSMSLKRASEDEGSGRFSTADSESGGSTMKFISGKFVATQSKKSPGEIIDQCNSMVHIRSRGSQSTVSSPVLVPGAVNGDEEIGDEKDQSDSVLGKNRLVVSKFLVAPSGGNCRVLAISSEIFSDVSKHISQLALWTVLDYMTERVKVSYSSSGVGFYFEITANILPSQSHSQWLDTQLHLQDREREGEGQSSCDTDGNR